MTKRCIELQGKGSTQRQKKKSTAGEEDLRTERERTRKGTRKNNRDHTRLGMTVGGSTQRKKSRRLRKKGKARKSTDGKLSPFAREENSTAVMGESRRPFPVEKQTSPPARRRWGNARRLKKERRATKTASGEASAKKKNHQKIFPTRAGRGQV